MNTKTYRDALTAQYAFHHLNRGGWSSTRSGCTVTSNAPAATLDNLEKNARAKRISG